MPHMISIDAGSSSLRSVLFDADGRRCFTARQRYSAFSPRSGYVEQRPDVWKQALFVTLKRAAQYASEKNLTIDAISVTSQRSSVFAIDAQGEVLCNAMTWHDKRSNPICDRLRKEEWRIFQKTGLRLDPMFSAPKMAWLRENEPDVYRKAHKLVGVHEYMLFCLCGDFLTDHAIASRMMLQNLFTLAWDEELLETFGIDEEKLCRVQTQSAVCGAFSAEAAEACGLPGGTPIVTAGGDQQCGALGLGILHPGQLEATTGTGAYVVGVSRRPAIDPEMRYLCNVAALPGSYILEAPILTAGNVYRWFADFCLDGGQSEPNRMEQANLLAEKAPPGANGVVFFPYFKGRGAPSWDSGRKGAIVNLTLETGKSDVARALLESLAYEIAENAAIIQDSYNGSPQPLLVSGGLAQIPLYNQMLADISNSKVVVGDDHEATALGAWICAGLAIGLFQNAGEGVKAAHRNRKSVVYDPNPESVCRYEQLKTERQKQYHQFYDDRNGGMNDESNREYYKGILGAGNIS